MGSALLGLIPLASVVVGGEPRSNSHHTPVPAPAWIVRKTNGKSGAQPRIALAHAEGQTKQQERRAVQPKHTQVEQRQQRTPARQQWSHDDAGQERRRQEAGQRERVRMLAQQSDAAAAVAHHLTEQAGQAVARVIVDPHARREPAAQAGPRHAMVELHVLAGVERLVEQADRVENLAAIGDGHALRRHEAFAVGVDVRGRMMAEPRRPRRGDGPLDTTRSRHVQRLRPAHAVGTAFGEGIRQFLQIMRVPQLAMSIDQQDDVAARRPHGGVASGAGPATRTVEQSQVGEARLHRRHDGARVVGRTAVGDDHLEAIRLVVLAEQLLQRVGDERRLVAHRHDDRDERARDNRRPSGGVPFAFLSDGWIVHRVHP